MVATCEGYLKEHLGPAHPGVATALLNRAVLLLERHRNATVRIVENVDWVVRASEYLEHAQQLLQNSYGTDRLVLADVHHNQGCCHEVMGDVVTALSHYMKSMKIRERFKDATGATELKLGLTMEHVAMIYRAVEEKLDDACRIMSAVAAMRRKYLGPLNPLYLQSLLQHGVIALEAKNRRLAKALLVKCLDLHSTVYGPEHELTLLTAVYVYEVDPVSAEQIFVCSTGRDNNEARENLRSKASSSTGIFATPSRAAGGGRRHSSPFETRSFPSSRQRSHSLPSPEGAFGEQRYAGQLRRENRPGSSSFHQFLHEEETRRAGATMTTESHRMQLNASGSIDLEVVSETDSRPGSTSRGATAAARQLLLPPRPSSGENRAASVGCGRRRSGSAGGSSTRSDSVPSSVEDLDAPSPQTLRDAAQRPHEYRPSMRSQEFR
jgi:hypothetical protein